MPLPLRLRSERPSCWQAQLTQPCDGQQCSLAFTRVRHFGPKSSERVNKRLRRALCPSGCGHPLASLHARPAWSFIAPQTRLERSNSSTVRSLQLRMPRITDTPVLATPAGAPPTTDAERGDGGAAGAADGEQVCRICLTGAADSEAGAGTLVQLACACKGGLRHVHARCADEWFAQRGALTLTEPQRPCSFHSHRLLRRAQAARCAKYAGLALGRPVLRRCRQQPGEQQLVAKPTRCTSPPVRGRRRTRCCSAVARGCTCWTRSTRPGSG